MNIEFSSDKKQEKGRMEAVLPFFTKKHHKIYKKETNNLPFMGNFAILRLSV
ncbi:MAG: hypothetical protein PUJ93_03690 [Oscillospiraceae bacterium]|nr:hypothetical protein [Oscillospiraceae bacterium]MDY5735826.1 hypothetical protein [Oscillospiraceae bacterium]